MQADEGDENGANNSGGGGDGSSSGDKVSERMSCSKIFGLEKNSAQYLDSIFEGYVIGEPLQTKRIRNIASKSSLSSPFSLPVLCACSEHLVCVCFRTACLRAVPFRLEQFEKVSRFVFFVCLITILPFDP